MNTRIACALLALVVVVETTEAEDATTSLQPFEESFDGQGEYAASGQVRTGFDAPYWALTLSGDATAEFGGGGLQLSNKGETGLSQAILTRHIGGGSFEEELHLSDFALGPMNGDPASSFAQLILIHTTGAGGHFQITFIENDRNQGSWWMSVLQDSRPLSYSQATELNTSVEAGKNIALKVAWDQESKRVKITYDNDTTTADNEDVTLADFKYTGAPIREGSVSLIIQRMNQGGAAAATVSHWRIAPTEEEE